MTTKESSEGSSGAAGVEETAKAQTGAADDEDTLSDGERKLILESARPKAPAQNVIAMDEDTMQGTDQSLLLESARPQAPARLAAEADDETTLTGEKKFTLEALGGGWDEAPTRIMSTEQKVSFVDAEKAAVSSKRSPAKPQPLGAASPTKSSPQSSSASARVARVKPPLPQRADKVSPATAPLEAPLERVLPAAAPLKAPSGAVSGEQPSSSRRRGSPSSTWEEEGDPPVGATSAPLGQPARSAAPAHAPVEPARSAAPAHAPVEQRAAPLRSEADSRSRSPSGAPAPAAVPAPVYRAPSVRPPPSRSRVPLLLVLIVPAAAAAGAALSHRFQAQSTEESIPTATAPVTAIASTRAPVLSLAERAEAGEATAIGELSSRAPNKLTVAETLALAKGQRIAKQRALEQFGKELQKEPSLLINPPQLARLRGYIADGDIAADALALVAKLPGPLGPDVLYDSWVKSQQAPEIARLAETLLHSEEVVAKASPALKVLIDLHRAKDCQAVQQALPQAKASADQRAVPALKKLLTRRGCGEDKLDDCYPCLRDVDTDPSVQATLTAVRQRPPPEL